MVDPDREQLIEEIARSRARVADLERERNAELMRIAEIEAEIAALDAIPVTSSDVAADPAAPTEPPASRPTSPRRSPQQKLQIFRELFRGREDVYPTRFEL